MSGISTDGIRVEPYGTWRSALTAEAVAEGGRGPVEARFVGDEVWWSEGVAAEHRTALLRRTGDGIEVVLPAPWNVRSGVHEYGGGAWTAVDGVVVFSHGGDGRLHRLDPAGPVPITPDTGARYGGLVPAGGAVLAIREVRTGDGPTDRARDLVLVPLDGSAADDAAAITSVVSGSRFLAQPRISPDGTRIAWIAWDHPSMPWDGTELRVGELADGRVTAWRTVLGGPEESVLQPEWLADGGLVALTDRSGWWNPVRVEEGGPVPLHPADRDTGGALWVLGTRWYLPLPDGRLLTASTFGSDEQLLLDPAGGTAEVLRADRSATSWQDLRDGRALLIDQSAHDALSLWELDVATGAFSLVRAGAVGLPPELFPEAELLEVDGVHAVVYRPRNPAYAAPAGERPPFVAFVHGGPTSQAGVRMKPSFAYYTSRGIGVVDVDHGGSTGYGRAYRRRLRGRWGVVDVADVVTVVRGLAERGIADGARLAIEGGSAGGWTVLSALTRTDAFAAGVSFYGVADAVALAEDTHDFEARYLDGLIGPYPEAAAVYAERAPINHVEGLATPVLLLQGLDDHVVPPAQSRRFRDALAARGVPHALVEYAGEGHGFRGREAIVSSREAALSFYGQVLGFVPPDVPVLPLER